MGSFVHCYSSDVVLSDGNMRVEIISVGLWVCEQLLDISLDLNTDLLFDILELGFCGPVVLHEHVLHQHYWISEVSHVLDFLSGSVSDAWV